MVIPALINKITQILKILFFKSTLLRLGTILRKLLHPSFSIFHSPFSIISCFLYYSYLDLVLISYSFLKSHSS